jgi:KDO2-lipid IV(A) lauroyltransferase
MGIAAGIEVLERLPEPAALAVGEQAGRLAAHLWPRRRQVARANLAAAFPDWSSGERERVLAAHLRLLGRTAAAWARLASLPEQEILAYLDFEGLPLLEEALDRGRGALVVTAHYGCFELILPGLRARLAPRRVTAVSRALRNPRLRTLVDERRRQGADAATLPQNALAIQRALHAGTAVGLLADHYLSQHRGGLLVPFLGRRAWTNPGPAILALRTGSPLILTHIRPLAAGRHLVTIGPEIVLPASGHRARDVTVVTERLNDAISEWIRERPELWLWPHRRFRASPDVGAAKREPGAGSGR